MLKVLKKRSRMKITKIPLILVGVLFSLFLFNACQTTKIFYIDYLNPAKINFPKELKKVGIVNAVVSDYTTQKTKPKWEKNKALLLGDAALLTESLAEHLAEANYFDEVVIYDSIIRLGEENAESQPLTTEEVNNLVDLLQVDFLISVEDIILNAEMNEYLISEFIISQLEVETKASMKAYLPNRVSHIFKDQITDTLYWDLNDPANFYMKEKQLVEEASIFAGERLASRLAPQWKTAERLLYIDGNKTLREANKLIKKNQWESAFDLWNDFYNSSDNVKNKMKAALNIAVYYEMKDNFEKAISWATLATDLAYEVDEVQDRTPNQIYGSYHYIPIKSYLDVLKKRADSSVQLEQQMNRFNDENN